MARLIESITVQGFGSYGPAPQTLVLGGRGPVAVIGLNGSGKSTIASKALTWALYGKTAPESMGGSTNALKGKQVLGETCKEAIVTVRLRDGDDTWTIERTRTAKIADRLTVVGPGGEEPDPDAAVERLAGSYEVFTRTVVRGQNDPWAFAEATDARKREILDEITGAALLAPKARAAADVAKRNRERAALADARAATLETQAAGAQREVDRLTADRDAWEAGRPGRVATAEAEVAAVQRSIQDAEEADRQRAVLLAQREAIQAREPARLDLTPWIQAETVATRASRDATFKLGAARSAFQAVASLGVGQACPTCGQAIGPAAPVAAKRQSAEVALAEAQDVCDKADEHETACMKSHRDAKAWDDQQRSGWLAELSAVPAPPNVAPRASLDQSLALARGRLLDAQTGVWWGAETLTRAAALVATLDAQAAEARALAAQARADEALAQDVAAALSPKGAPAHLSEAVLGAVEMEANHWLAVLSDGRLSVTFSATGVTGDGKEKEQIQTRVWVQGDNPTSRDLLSFSGGERARINLAVDLGVAAALSGQRSSLSLLVLDEAVVSGLDQPGKAAVLSAIHAAGVADIVVVDHDAQLSAALPRTIVARRGDSGYSVVEEVR